MKKGTSLPGRPLRRAREMPVSISSRVGAHIGQAWALVKTMPWPASRSRFGVGIREPKQPSDFSPKSSTRMRRMLGRLGAGWRGWRPGRKSDGNRKGQEGSCDYGDK